MSNNLIFTANRTHKMLFLSLITAILFLSHSAYAIYESSQNEVPNFDIENSQSNLALARIEHSKGKWTEALFALERAVVIDPKNYEAQLFLGQVYAQLGQKDTAETQFKLVIDAKNDQSTAAQVALDNLKYVREWSYDAIVGYRVGHDDNINSGLDNTSIFIPSNNISLTLPDSSGENDETTQTLYASGRARYQHTDTLSYIIKGTASKTDDDFFNQAYAAIDLGARLNYEKTQQTFRFIQSYVDYDNFDEIDISRLNYEYLRLLNGKNYYKISVDLQDLNYSDQDIRDDRRISVRGQYRHLLSPSLSLTSELFYAKDIKSENSSGDLDFDTYGSRTTLRKQLNNTLALSFDVDYRVNNYDGDDQLFLRERLDKRLHFRSKLSWEFIDKTTLSVAYQHTNNDSNISLYDFDKNVFFIDIAKRF